MADDDDEKRDGGSQLSHPRDYLIPLKSPLGKLIARPWLDRATIRLLADGVMPTSRAWAAAIASDGRVERFLDGVRARRGTPKVGAILAGRIPATAAAAERLAAADSHWRAVLFDTVDPTDREAVAAEDARLSAAHNLGLHRFWYGWFAWRYRVDPCRWSILEPDAVEQSHGRRLGQVRFPLPERMPVVRQSNPVPTVRGRDYWLTFQVPDAPIDGACWARVFEPADLPEGAPTVILLHGICVELEQWKVPWRDVEVMMDAGLRVVMPEGPWHGRRRAPGHYGGEPVVARAPVGTIDYFATHVPEVAALTHWAHGKGGPVGLFGISLGSFVAQLVLSEAGAWPQAYRPDAGFLVATSQGLDTIGLTGAFGRAFKLDHALRRAGWTEELLRRWGALMTPGERPCVDPSALVMLLGTEDEVAPYAGGAALARDWQVPDDNVFERHQGHFSVAAGMMVDDAPTKAFIDRIKRL